MTHLRCEGEESEDRYDLLLRETQSNDNNLSLLARNVASYQRARGLVHVKSFIIAFAPVGHSCVLLNHLHPRRTAGRLFTFHGRF